MLLVSTAAIKEYRCRKHDEREDAKTGQDDVQAGQRRNRVCAEAITLVKEGSIEFHVPNAKLGERGTLTA
jgi:hypothetical protein